MVRTIGWSCRWLGVASALALACGDDGALADESSSSSSTSPTTSSTSPTTSSSSGQLDTSTSSGGPETGSSSDESESSSSTTSGETTPEPLRAVLVGDPLGDGSLWSYLVESDGVTVNEPMLVDGPAPAGGDVGVSVLSPSLLLTRVDAADGTRTHGLVDISGEMPSAPAPVVLAPAPTGHVRQIAALANDELVFASADTVDAAAEIWGTSYEGTIAAAPERISPDVAGFGYRAFATSPAEDAVLAVRTETATGIDNLVWMPRAPADPDAAVVLTAFDQDTQQIQQLGFLADADHVWFTGSIESEAHEELFVDDLAPGTPPVRVNPALVGEEFLYALRLSPDRSAFLFWLGLNELGTGTHGDIFVVPVQDGVVGTPIDVTPGDQITHWNVEVSPHWNWVMYRVGSTEDLHVEVVGIADGVASTPLVLDSAHSLSEVAFSVDDEALFYIDDADRLLRRVTLGEQLGQAEIVSDVAAAGFPRPAPSGAWLGFTADDDVGYAHYAVDLGGALPGTTLRIDVAPEPGADVGTSMDFTPDENYAYYTEFTDPETPRALRATRLVEGGATLLLGHTFLGYSILPPR